jgi:Peptidase of plants and bacteria
MRHTPPLILMALAFGQTAAAADAPVPAVAASTLATGGDHIRQFAFDDDPATYFESAGNATQADHFTVTFDAPVAVRSVRVTTGRPEGGDALDRGTLEGSADGKTFEPLVAFAAGTAQAAPAGRKLVALRVRPAADLAHPLVIREIAVTSDPAVVTFKYPVEFRVTSEDPELTAWAEKAGGICERQYAMICEALQSDGFMPRTTVSLTLRNNYNGVAAAGGGRITGSVRYFKAHPEDFGAMVHETVHVVQSYRTRGNPGWLVEGIADYVRFYRYEKDPRPPPRPDRARYDGSYRVTARFLNYVAEKYDKDLVRKLNTAMREGEYKPELWQALTKKTVQELGEEWKESLK